VEIVILFSRRRKITLFPKSLFLTDPLVSKLTASTDERLT